MVWAGDAFWGYIPFSRSPQTVSSHSNRVAVHLLFYSFTTTSPCLHARIACKLCSLSVYKVCFIYFIISNCFLVVFCGSSGPRAPMAATLTDQIMSVDTYWKDNRGSVENIQFLRIISYISQQLNSWHHDIIRKSDRPRNWTQNLKKIFNNITWLFWADMLTTILY